MMRRLVVRVLVMAGLLVAATGCIKLDAQYEVHSDNTVSGTAIVGLSKQLAAMAGDEMDLADRMLDQDPPAGVTVTKWHNDEFVGSKITYEALPLEKLNAQSEDLTIRRKGDRFVLDGSFTTRQDESSGDSDNPLSDDEDGMGDTGQQLAKGMMSSAEVQISVTFPGEVLQTNGTIQDDGRTVVWQPDLGETQGLHAVAEAESGSSTVGLAIWIGVAVLVLAACGAGVMLAQRRGQPAEQAEAVSGPTPSE